LGKGADHAPVRWCHANLIGMVFACSIPMITLVIATAVISSATAPERPIKDCIIDGREMRCVVMNGPDGAVVVPYGGMKPRTGDLDQGLVTRGRTAR
jgi:hypothetical protein